MEKEANLKVTYSPLCNDLIYEWWCLKCQCYHYYPWCPWDKNELTDDSIHKPIRYEICSHCGQLIKKN